MPQQCIYLDNAASTPVDPRVVEAMYQNLNSEAGYGNAASTHYAGYLAAQVIEKAAAQVAGLLNCAPSDLIWTSGATQSIDLALKGVFEGYSGKNQIITLTTEHQATLNTCQNLEGRGARITRLAPGPDGRVDLADLRAAIGPQTLLISIMHVNNEIGLIQDIVAIAAEARERGVLLHVDAAQSLGKLPLDLQAIPIDLLSGSAHKIYGPKGIGVLFARAPVRAHMAVQLGTLATHQIVGFGEAAALAQRLMQEDEARVTQLRDRLWAGLSDLAGIYRVGAVALCSPYILNMGFEGIAAESWMEALPDLAFSSGSACHSSSLSSSYVLKSLGLSEAQAKASLRFSFGRETTLAEIEQAITQVRAVYERLKGLFVQRCTIRRGK